MRLTLANIEMETTLSQDCKKMSIALVRCMFITIIRSGEIFVLVLCCRFSEEKYLCRCNMYFCKTRRFSPVEVRLIKDRPGPGGHCPVPGWSPLESYDNNFKQKSVPGRCHYTLIDTTKRRTGAEGFLVVPKLHQAPYDV